MRMSLKLALSVCALGGVLAYPAAANAELYFNRYMDGSWLNAEYNDGICHYYYSHNAADGETHVNRYGDCSRVAIGPNGEAIPVMPQALAVPPY
ncbi:MAG TPA: hypothetical protein VFA57_17025 [Pseudolabrys sp.]|nr:hypothetical protein [Pseudolabrys sp.]